MNFSQYLAHTSPLFHSMEVLPFKKIYYHRIGLMMYKFNNNLLPNCLSQLYERINSIHDHNTRGCQQYNVGVQFKNWTNKNTVTM